ncbi:CpsD/CapB family tyrosine-protein kinase [Sphingobium estronivorans]|uniref:CpsD/CapB family tyrosine-protein kinase n=1 Tax=Sphingobium estronivorans TaxID=1577690 RepID=UPI00123B220B|nr:CpsD/CapB family tyrosine-protein kinase [Sphingobium estronivorans]
MSDNQDGQLLDSPADSEKQTMAPSQPEVQFHLSDQVVITFGAGSPEGESIGALRTQLMSQHLKEGRRALAICSPSKAGRTSFLAVNLAVALTQAGVRTLLVDTNMRAPHVQSYIVPSRPVRGLADCLEDSAIEFGEVIHDDVLPSLSVVFAGDPTDKSQELLAGPRFKALVDLCMREYDMILFDTAPTNACADAQIVAMLAHYGLVVARKNMSYVNDIKTLIADMRANRVEVIGTVINEM